MTGNEQDWELEFADKHRIQEFIDILSMNELSFMEEYAIVSLIISSYEDYLFDQEDKGEKLWSEIVKLLDSHKESYTDIINYWAVWEEDTNWFNITPLIRRYAKASTRL